MESLEKLENLEDIELIFDTSIIIEDKSLEINEKMFHEEKKVNLIKFTNFVFKFFLFIQLFI